MSATLQATGRLLLLVVILEQVHGKPQHLTKAPPQALELTLLGADMMQWNISLPSNFKSSHILVVSGVDLHSLKQKLAESFAKEEEEEDALCKAVGGSYVGSRDVSSMEQLLEECGLPRPRGLNWSAAAHTAGVLCIRDSQAAVSGVAKLPVSPYLLGLTIGT